MGNLSVSTDITNALLADRPLRIVDIGASGGLHKRWLKFGSHLVAVLVEPDPRAAESLKGCGKHKTVIIEQALSDRQSNIPFHLCKKQQVSSAYKPNIRFLKMFPEVERFDVTRCIEVAADTLDNQLRFHDLHAIDFIKIDTQGYELAILKGAEQTLQHVIGMEIEVEFAPMYEGQPLFADVHAWVSAQGFELFDLNRGFWKRTHTGNLRDHRRGQLIFADALYFRPPEALLRMDAVDESKIIRAIFVYLAYGYLDLAKVLYLMARDGGFLSGDASRNLDSLLICHCKKDIFPNLRGRVRIGNFIHRIAEYVAPSVWYKLDPRIGN